MNKYFILGFMIGIIIFMNVGFADWCNTDYNYIKNITIANTTYMPDDYPIIITSFNSSSYALTEGQDIIIYDGSCDIVPFGLIRIGADDFNLTFKINQTGSSSDYSVYFGNTTPVSFANSSWNNIRYNFWDDFEGGNFNKWTNNATTDCTIESTYVYQGSYSAKCPSSGEAYLYKNMTLRGNVYTQISLNASASAEFYKNSVENSTDESFFDLTLYNNVWRYFAFETRYNFTNDPPYTPNSWYVIETWTNFTTGNMTTHANDTNFGDIPLYDYYGTVHTQSSDITQLKFDSGAGVIYADDYYVYQFSNPEPTFLISGESINQIVEYEYAETYNPNAYELVNNSYSLNFTINATVVIDVNAIMELNATNYTTTKIASSNTFDFLFYNITDLYTAEGNLTHKWYFNVTFANASVVAGNTSSALQNALFSYNIATFAPDSTDYTIGETSIFNLTYTSLSDLGYIFGWMQFNNTNYTSTLSGNDLITGVLLDADLAGQSFIGNGYMGINYNGRTRYHNKTGSSISVHDFNITNCTGSGTTSLIFYGYEEKTLAAENFTMDITFTIWNENVTKNTSLSYINANYSCSVCINPSSGSFNVNATLDYSNTPAYDTRHYFLTNLLLTNVSQTVDLYLLNTTYDEIFEFEIRDGSGNLVEGAIVKAQRWYAGTGAYKNVAMARTSADGTTILNLEKNTAWYRFLVEEGGVVKKTTSTSIIHDDQSITILDATLGDWFNYNQYISYNCNLNATDYIVCSINNAKGTNIEGNLFVEEMGTTGWINICDISETGSSVAFACYVGNTTDRKIHYVLSWITHGSGTTVNLIDDIIDNFIAIGFGSTGLFITMLLVLVLFLIGLYNPDIALILTIVGLAGSYLIGLFQIGLAPLIGIITVILIIIGIRGSRK